MEARALCDEKPFGAAEEKFAELKVTLGSAEAMQLAHGDLENLVAREGREIHRLLLEAHLKMRSACERVDESVRGADGVERSHVRERGRSLHTVFGPVPVRRRAYGARGESSLSPMDASLNLPPECHSHGLRRLAAVEAARGSFDAAVEAIERCTGTRVPKRQVEQLVARAAQDFDAFYGRRESSPTSAKDVLVLTLDGKGIVMREEDLRECTRKAAVEHKLKRRLSKGEQRFRKRMATVAAVYDLKPQARRPEEVMGELRPVAVAASPRPRAQNKRVWASVEKSMEEVTGAVFDEAQRRDARQARRWVVLVDGNNHQLAHVRAVARKRGLKATIIIDFIHVLEYLWKAAWCFFKEGDTRAERWVAERALGVLRGNSGQVAGGIRRSATRRALAADKRKGVNDCARYLRTKRHLLRYDEYLRDGLPIATGVIEGACRHLISDRMDITGARWSLAGAEAILRLRSLRSSGQFDEYWLMHLAAERHRNHTSKYAPPQAPSRATTALRLIEGGASS
jgi:hypothetical protein